MIEEDEDLARIEDIRRWHSDKRDPGDDLWRGVDALLAHVDRLQTDLDENYVDNETFDENVRERDEQIEDLERKIEAERRQIERLEEAYYAREERLAELWPEYVM